MSLFDKVAIVKWNKLARTLLSVILHCNKCVVLLSDSVSPVKYVFIYFHLNWANVNKIRKSNMFVFCWILQLILLQESRNKMPKFEELEAHSSCHVHSLSTPITPVPSNLIAKRYSILQRLGRGSFGTVYLVQDTRARDGEKLWVCLLLLSCAALHMSTAQCPPCPLLEMGQIFHIAYTSPILLDKCVGGRDRWLGV